MELVNSMRKYLKLYISFIRLNFSKLLAYRGNFINSSFTSVLWAIFSVISILLLTNRSQSVFGWNRNELLILTGVYSIFIGLFHVIFTRNLEQLSRIVHRGQLDGILLKPVDTQFYLSCSIVNYSSLSRVIGAVIFVLVLLQNLHIQLDIVDIFKFVLLGIIGIIFLYASWYSIIAITIWQSHLFNLSDLLFHITDSAKYPSEMYSEFRYYITIFLLPISLIITLPTKALLNMLNLTDVAPLVMLAVVSLMISRVWGKYVLRFYTSASS